MWYLLLFNPSDSFGEFGELARHITEFNKNLLRPRVNSWSQSVVIFTGYNK